MKIIYTLRVIVEIEILSRYTVYRVLAYMIRFA